MMDGDVLLRLTDEIARFNQVLAELRAEVAAYSAAPVGEAVLFRRLALRTDDAMARLDGLTADLAAWNAMLPHPPRDARPGASQTDGVACDP